MLSREPAEPPPGQWAHLRLFETSVPVDCRVTLGEGATPLQEVPELAAALGVPGLLVKREDLSPTGSHKARSLGLLISDLLSQGRRQAVISSSGNAAIAAAAYSKAAGIRTLCLISPLIPRVKLEALLGHGATVVASSRPVELLHHASHRWGLADLRASTHRLGPVAYRGIAAELAEAGRWIAVFTFANSGATALGLDQGFRLLGEESPQLHVVEGWPGGELTRPWYRGSTPRPGARVGDLGTRRSRLTPAVRRAMRESGGRGWRVDRKQLDEVVELAAGLRPPTSWEGLAALAAARQWAKTAHPKGPVGVLLTGASEQLDRTLHPDISQLVPVVETTSELDRLLELAGFQRAPAGD